MRQGCLIAVVGAFVIGCAVLLAGGCSLKGRSEAPKEEQGRTEATERQARSPEATSEEARCGGMRSIKWYGESIVTNDVPGCPKGGLLSGTDKPDNPEGRVGDDEIRGP